MERVTVIIEKSDHNFSAYIEGIDGIAVTGDTIDEIKQRMAEAIQFYVEVAQEEGLEVPEPFKGEYELSFKMDMVSFFEFYTKIFSKAGLERLSGINQKQLWNYASGKRRPRPEQSVRLETALHKLGEELIAISL